MLMASFLWCKKYQWHSLSVSNILKIDLLFSNNGIVVFLEHTEKFISQQTHRKAKGFRITRGSNIFSIRSHTFWLEVKDFIKINLKFILEGNCYLGLVKGNPLLGNLGYNSNLSQIETCFNLYWIMVLYILNSLINPFHTAIGLWKKEQKLIIQSCY